MRTDDPETLVQALMAIDHAELHLGMPVAGTHTQEALEICAAQGYRPRESIARANLGNFAFYAGRWDEAVEWYRSSRRVALEAGNDFGAAETDVSLGDILVSRGQLDEAEAVLQDAVRVLRVSGMDFEAAYGEMQLARARLARGQLDEADRLIAAVVARFVALGHRMTAFEASLVWAEVTTLAGRPEQALAIVADAESAARGEGAPLRARSACSGRAPCSRSTGSDECEQALSAGLEAAVEQDLPYEQALLLGVRARLGTRRGDPDAATTDACRGATAPHPARCRGARSALTCA